MAASKCLSVYLSMPSKEVPTYPELLGELWKGVDGGAGGGREVYVPKVGRRVYRKTIEEGVCVCRWRRITEAAVRAGFD